MPDHPFPDEAPDDTCRMSMLPVDQHGVERIAEIVDRIREQGDAATPDDDQQLQHRGEAEQRQRQPERSSH